MSGNDLRRLARKPWRKVPSLLQGLPNSTNSTGEAQVVVLD